MADFKVSKEVVEVKPHLNADALEILKVGGYQMVAKKGLYQDGDVVVIIPKASVIPPGPILEEFQNYLVGPEKNRVKAIRLRGEVSEAITWPLDKLEELAVEQDSSTGILGDRILLGKYTRLQEAEVGEDISEILGIKEYEPPIPSNMTGEVAPYSGYARKHDVSHYASYADELTGDVTVTEKIHGTQLNYIVDRDGKEIVASKGILKKGLSIKEDEGNVYWQAVRNSNLYNLSFLLSGEQVQFLGEVIPTQKGFTYGGGEKRAVLFDVVVDGASIPYEDLPEEIKELWVPIFHQGAIPFPEELENLSKGKEQVSGKEEHIREGIVVKALNDAKAEDGTRLVLKVLNPKYKEEDSFN